MIIITIYIFDIFALQLYGIIYSCLIGVIFEITNLGQSGSGSNGNKGIPHTPQISRTGDAPSVEVWCHTQSIPFG